MIFVARKLAPVAEEGVEGSFDRLNRLLKCNLRRKSNEVSQAFAGEPHDAFA